MKTFSKIVKTRLAQKSLLFTTHHYNYRKFTDATMFEYK